MRISLSFRRAFRNIDNISSYLESWYAFGLDGVVSGARDASSKLRLAAPGDAYTRWQRLVDMYTKAKTLPIVTISGSCSVPGLWYYYLQELYAVVKYGIEHVLWARGYSALRSPMERVLNEPCGSQSAFHSCRSP